MSVEERHLLNKIRFFEDMLLRSKDYRQQENTGKHRKGIDCNAYSVTETTV